MNKYAIFGSFSLDVELPEINHVKMPDGSPATLQIEDAAFREHNLNAHGWPANNIQEYMNRENCDVAQMYLKNIEIQKSMRDPDSSLSNEQKAALCASRTMQTASEFLDESMRIDKVRARFAAARERLNPSSDDGFEPAEKKTDSDIIDNV